MNNTAQAETAGKEDGAMNPQPDNLSKFRAAYLDYLEGDRGEPPSQDRLSDDERRIAQAFIQSSADAAGIDPYASRPSFEQLLARIEPGPAVAVHAVPAPQSAVALSDAERRVQLHKALPLAKVRSRGWIPPTKDLETTEAAVCDLLEIPHLGEQPPFAYAARRSNTHEPITPAQTAWLGRVRKIAQTQQTPPYDVAGLESAAERLPRALQDGPSKMRRAVDLLAGCGVRLVFCQGLSGGKLAGAVTFLPGGGPVIGLTTRGDRFDSVVHTLLHECAHLTRGHIDPQSGPILDDENHAKATEDEREQEANAQATRWLFPNGLNMAAACRDIEASAKRHSVHPSCVAGHIQHIADNWKMLNEHRCNVRDELEAAGLLSK